MKIMSKYNHIMTAVFALVMAAMCPPGASSQTLRGDFNMDGDVNISDVIPLINYILNDRIGEVPPEGRDTIMVNDIPVVMVRVKAGTYTLKYGEVTTIESDFWIGQTEVTRELWWEVMGGRPTNPVAAEKQRNYAVNNVSWDQCQVFIDSLNRMTGMEFRLPYSEEWIYAATGGTLTCGYDYSGSNDINEVAWYNGNSDEIEVNGSLVFNVATKNPNELGLYDMSGNVAEWCQDLREHTDGYRTAALFGGDVESSADECRPTSYVYADATRRSGYSGLRLYLPATE